LQCGRSGNERFADEEKQWDNIYGDSKDDEIKRKVDDGNDADDDDCKVANEYVPLISKLDDQECKEITENVAQLDEIMEEVQKRKPLHIHAKTLHPALMGERLVPCMRKTTRLKALLKKAHAKLQVFLKLITRKNNLCSPLFGYFRKVNESPLIDSLQ